jgi:type III secretion protein D
MKLLRILTGVHAGAQLRLSPGEYRLGADDDADIRISDWSGADLLLTLDDEGVVRARRREAMNFGFVPGSHESLTGSGRAHDDRVQAEQMPNSTEDIARSPASAHEPEILLVDFVPMQFDHTVLCVGSPDAVWPTDVELLSTLLVKPDQLRRAAQRARHRKVAAVVLGCVVAGAAVALSPLLATMQDSRAAGAHTINDLATHINTELAAQHLAELRAQVAGPNILVTGMVATQADDLATRTVLQRIAPGVALRQYDIAEIDVRNISESLGTSSAQVRYGGQGVFDITATVDDPPAFETAVARVRQDLDGNVKQLRTHVTQAQKKTSPPPFSELIAADGVQYAQTPDGVKHIYLGPQKPGGEPLAAVAAAYSVTGSDDDAQRENASHAPS